MSTIDLHTASQQHHIMTDLIPLHIVHCQAAGLAVKTIKTRREVLIRVDHAIGLEQASTEELESWLAPWRGWTLKTYSTHIRSFYRWATTGHNPHLSWDPTEDIARPHAPRTLPRPTSEQNLAAILALAPPRWQPVLRLAAFAGLRASEIAALTREQIDRRDIVVVFGKGNKTRVVPMHMRIWSHVRDLPPGPIMTGRAGRRLTADRMSKAASDAMTKIGFRGETLHKLRHRYATMMLTPVELGGAGATLRAVQELLGHSSVATTEIYTLVTDRQRRSAVARLPSPEVDLAAIAA